ncbi:MAG: cobyric acid synthase [Desulfuromonadaceae bacterium]|nr:cobyric acid synthase [Desulfuromonadaceae bacterium]
MTPLDIKSTLPPRHQHGGNLTQLRQRSGLSAHELVDFSASLNPLGPPEWLRPLLSAHVSALAHYPDPDCSALSAALAAHYQVAPSQVLVGNGASELLHLLPRALGKTRLVIPVPSYADYEDVARLNGMTIERILLTEHNNFQLDFAILEAHLDAETLVILGQPNNPTGALYPTEQLRAVAQRHPETSFLIDESFIDLTAEGHSLSLTHARPPNVVIVQSLTKTYAIAGLRLGSAIGEADLIERCRRLQPPWSVNTLAQEVGLAAIRDTDYRARSRAYVCTQRQALQELLAQLPGVTVYPGAANFLLCRLEHPHFDAVLLAQQTLKQGVALRVCANFAGLDSRFFRVAVRTVEEQQRLEQVLTALLAPHRAAPQRRKTPAIMFQGTGSNAGKSVLTAAMCRILRQDGYAVAPFKAQNMSLNSFVTRAGGEMGRAQVMQAQACGLDPDVRMNPVLLKPNSTTGSQIIVLGKVIGSLHFRAYAQQRQSIFEQVKHSYDSLAAEHEVMVLEGAGSPAEINLKSGDIVNMNMARYAKAPVLLVGDIDRGGVFASFVGTMELFNEAERAQVAGFVINRFRGDPTLLGSALDATLHHTGRPVLGTVPFLEQLGLPEEDSLSFKQDARYTSGKTQTDIADADVIDIAVIDLPHISNFTDIDPLTIEPDVRVRVVSRAEELGSPDAVLIPGSKNVAADLHHLRTSGMAECLLALAATEKCEIIGICAGFQMLGTTLHDPHALAGSVSTLSGLGLLPFDTYLERHKTTLQTRCRHLPSGHELVGYEIHQGRSNIADLQPILCNAAGELIGGGGHDGRIWGTYLHGLFDADPFRRWFIDTLRRRRGWKCDGEIRARYDLEPAFDRLAATVREALDIQAIYRSMGL